MRSRTVGRQESGWTLETLYAHISAVLAETDLRYQQRFESQTKALEAAFSAADKAVTAALTAAEKAVTKAEVAAEKRFDAVNEFRGAYQDIIREQMPRAEAEQRLSALAEKVDDLKLGATQSAGRSEGIAAGWVYVIGAVSLLGTLVAIYAALKN